MSRCGTCYYAGSPTSYGECKCSYHGIWVGENESACSHYKDNCAIATAVLNKTKVYNKPEGQDIIQALVEFREEYLMATPKGRALLARYHVLGRKIGEMLLKEDVKFSESVRKVFLDPIVMKIKAKEYRAVEQMYTAMVRFLQAQFYNNK